VGGLTSLALLAHHFQARYPDVASFSRFLFFVFLVFLFLLLVSSFCRQCARNCHFVTEMLQKLYGFAAKPIGLPILSSYRILPRFIAFLQASGDCRERRVASISEDALLDPIL
jgi:hypothetical protein